MNQIKTEQEFNNLISSNQTVVIDFYADWCGPCKMMAPFFEQVASEESSITFAKINVDELEALSMRYEITSIPTIIIFKDGKLSKRHSGFMNKETLLDFVRNT